MDISSELLERLPQEKREQFEAIRAEKRRILEANPLQGFHACSEPCGQLGCQARAKQHEFMAALTRIVAAFAGNRFGKTVGLVVWVIIQHTPEEMLPERLRPFKRATSKIVQGWYLCPSQKAIETIILPEMRRWMPKSLLRGGGWDKAYSKQHNIVYFADGGYLGFYTYEQDPQVLVGASLDYVVYDEPPPEAHYRECLPRTTDRGGCHRFGMTPVNMKGGGIGWIKRTIFDPKQDPDITVVRGSIHDNPLLDEKEVAFTLAQFPEDERQAREHGDFIHFGGMIYPGGFDRYLKPVPSPDQLTYQDVYVGIDPGLKNAAFVWVAFDNDNRAFVFDELLIKEGTPIDYARHIRKVNARWSLSEARQNDPVYIIDPSARNRSLINAESVQGELERQGIFCIHGQNQVQAGVQQVRRRLVEGGLHIAEDCRDLRGEADEYRMEDRPDGEFKVVKENDHRLDALRYALMARPWYADPVENLVEERWREGWAPPVEWLEGQNVVAVDGPPMGHLS